MLTAKNVLHCQVSVKYRNISNDKYNTYLMPYNSVLTLYILRQQYIQCFYVYIQVTEECYTSDQRENTKQYFIMIRGKYSTLYTLWKIKHSYQLQTYVV